MNKYVQKYEDHFPKIWTTNMEAKPKHAPYIKVLREYNDLYKNPKAKGRIKKLDKLQDKINYILDNK